MESNKTGSFMNLFEDQPLEGPQEVVHALLQNFGNNKKVHAAIGQGCQFAPPQRASAHTHSLDPGGSILLLNATRSSRIPPSRPLSHSLPNQRLSVRRFRADHLRAAAHALLLQGFR
jgi:hypothetical protein